MKSRNGHLTFTAAFFSTSALLAMLNHSPASHGVQPATLKVSHPNPVPAEFRGCESARMCRFWIESLMPLTESMYVVRPNGVSVGTDGDATAVRDRLNSLLSNMIHQHKRIELLDLRQLGDGTYAATVTVNGMDVSEDAILEELAKRSKN